MEKIYNHWRTLACDGPIRNGYSVADITYSFDAIDDDNKEYYGKKRKTLKAAINDAKQCFKNHQDAYFSIYAHAILKEFYEDGTQYGKTDKDCARIGSLDSFGEYFDLCESVEWLG